MKNLVIAIAILIVGIGLILEYRYAVIIDSPIVAKIDRLTGDAWIANSGLWRKVEHAAAANDRPQEKAVNPKPAAK